MQLHPPSTARRQLSYSLPPPSSALVLHLTTGTLPWAELTPFHPLNQLWLGKELAEARWVPRVTSRLMSNLMGSSGRADAPKCVQTGA